MQKKIFSLWAVLLFHSLCFANTAQESELPDDPDQNDSNELAYGQEESDIAATRENKKESRRSRKLSKDPQARDVHLKGEEEYQIYQPELWVYLPEI